MSPEPTRPADMFALAQSLTIAADNTKGPARNALLVAAASVETAARALAGEEAKVAYERAADDEMVKGLVGEAKLYEDSRGGVITGDVDPKKPWTYDAYRRP